ncbi:MAG: energy-coupling factor transporter transmembrane component T [Lachnospiraceae bacterium]|nr:energy-coupling factor transporter transmembrane component T [Lachnospiraceae bacterium]
MLKDITLGQYYPADSVVHKLDPRVKLLWTLVFIISLFVFDSVGSYLVASLVLFGLIRLSKVPFSFITKGLKPILVLMMITVAFNLFLTPGTVLVTVWKLKITEEGLKAAGHMAVRLIYLVMGSSIMTLTTTPTSLTDGMEKGLRFMRTFKVPVHEIAMMMSIALRFIPILMDETDKIMKAQKARCADFESGNIIQKAKSLVPILVPLFISAFRRANDLAMAMEARGYQGGEGRTRMYPLCYEKRDRMAYVVLALYVVVMFIAARFMTLKFLMGLVG